MFELLDEWRSRSNRQAPYAPIDPLGGIGPGPLSEPDEPMGPSLEPFSTCGVCEGDRFLRTEPMGGSTVRLSVVCDSCGHRTDI